MFPKKKLVRKKVWKMISLTLPTTSFPVTSFPVTSGDFTIPLKCAPGSTWYTTDPSLKRGRHGRDCMVVGFITTYSISAYHHFHCEFEPRSGEVQYYVIKFFSDLLQVGSLLLVIRFPPPIKQTAIWNCHFELVG